MKRMVWAEYREKDDIYNAETVSTLRWWIQCRSCTTMVAQYKGFWKLER
jgi:hypothetical protein